MVIAGSVALIVLGLIWCAFFALRKEWFVSSCEALIAGCGLAALWLTRRARVRQAALLLIGGLFFVVAGMAMWMDLPTPQVPRSVHHFLIPLGLAGFLLFTEEVALLKHGVPTMCFAAVAYFSMPETGYVGLVEISQEVRSGGIWANNFAAMILLALLCHVFFGDIDRMESYLHSANNQFVGLMRRMFPHSVAERLLTSGHSFAEKFDSATVLFADIVGFTRCTAHLAPQEMVNLLNDLFSRFDRSVEELGLTKIKTIGDAYLVAAGVPESRADHAQMMIKLAIRLLKEAHELDGLEVRIGIASGPLVAGVIGQSRQLFDVWGDVVNMASRMESHGLPGRIQVSQACHALVKDDFDFEERSGIKIKGKPGFHDVFLVRTVTA